MSDEATEGTLPATVEEQPEESQYEQHPGETHPNRKVTRNLVTVLNEDELRLKGHKLAELEQTMLAKEEEKKAMAKEYNDAINALKEAIYALSEQVMDGAEERSIDCLEEKILASNMIRVTRLDTMEIIEERAMSAEERQGDLGL